jgi:hypothetical protein
LESIRESSLKDIPLDRPQEMKPKPKRGRPRKYPLLVPAQVMLTASTPEVPKSIPIPPEPI